MGDRGQQGDAARPSGSHRRCACENVKAYNLAEVCVALGLAGQRDEYDNPAASKRVYVRSRILTKPMPELVDLARRLVEEYDDDKLRALLDRLGVAHGGHGRPQEHHLRRRRASVDQAELSVLDDLDLVVDGVSQHQARLGADRCRPTD